MPGYNKNFLRGATLALPSLTEAQKKLRAPLKNNPQKFELAYTHFSIVQNKKRKFAFYAATNIDGNTWNADVKARKNFVKDGQLSSDYQIGNELYDFLKSKTDNDFDKGHITKFQDPQWGDAETAKRAADETMRFTNCVPQHHTLNRGAWKSLEDYVLKKFTPKHGANGRKVTVFAGPLLLNNDPYYIDHIDNKRLQIPCHFWKVIIYPNKQNKLSAVAFLMSQKTILLRKKFVVTKKIAAKGIEATTEDFFSDFTSGEPYQISIAFLEQATRFNFGLQSMVQPYTKKESTKLIYKRVEVPLADTKSASKKAEDEPLNFKFIGIHL